jgi:hypothetical protein
MPYSSSPKKLRLRLARLRQRKAALDATIQLIERYRAILDSPLLPVLLATARRNRPTLNGFAFRSSRL